MPGTYISPAETGFYYLQSRYYDPENCRFINADSQINLDGFVDYNMFAYCCNNPVACSDYDGRDQEYVIYTIKQEFRVGNIRFVITTTFYLTVPDGMPYEIAWSKSEFSLGGSLSNFNVTFVKEHSEKTGNYTVSLTLYNDEILSASLNLDGSVSVRKEVDDYTSIEYNVQAFIDDDGNGSSPPWALQPQEESVWDVIFDTGEKIIVGGAIIVGGCIAIGLCCGLPPSKEATCSFA